MNGKKSEMKEWQCQTKLALHFVAGVFLKYQPPSTITFGKAHISVNSLYHLEPKVIYHWVASGNQW